MLSSKWILCCFLLTTLILSSVFAQPTPTTTLVKRQEVETNSVNEFNKATVSRKSSSTKTATATATETGKGGGSNGSHNGSPAIIPAATTAWFVAVYGTESGISSRMASLGAILIVLGLFLCSMGFRRFKEMLCVMGLLTFGSMTWIGLANCRPVSGYPMDSILMIVVPVCVGLVGAVAYYVLWNIALYLVCAFGGFIFAIFVLSWKSDLVIVSLIGRPCFLGGMALLTGVVTFFALRPMLFFATSFVGAYIFMFGVDCLSRTGLIAAPQAMLNRNPNHLVEYSINKYIYVMLAMIILMFLMSMAWQMLFNAAHHLGMHIVAAAKGKPAHEEPKEEATEGHPPSSPPPS
ncbi:uncharacterized protein EV154DRAFT_510016 [Mucor mucedo]|uniref:uncharacterized protein n=1 Tax=Mucor mucedo TaxID=29922 RepID=UPI00221FD2D9|nr:uncharacterized protein EV154DRAFT_510016 [Mucor mucedo]KAI7890928.1 hypothetical protein EV154DRAFT_510016 [Mucor mucedo]